MRFIPLLALLPLLATSSPTPKAQPEAEAAPYNPFFPPDSAYKKIYGNLDKRVYSKEDLDSRAALEHAGQAQIDLARSSSKTQRKRHGELKRGTYRKIKRSAKRAKACNASPSASSASSATTSVSTTFIGGGAIATPSSAITSSVQTTSKATPTTTTTSSASSPTTTLYTVDPAGNGPFSGWGTWFDVGLSACGTYDTPGMPIVAVSRQIFDSWPGYNGLNPNNNPICGLHLDITWGGKTVTAEVTDRCPDCAPRSLDMSKGLFHAFADYSVGLLGMETYTGNITWSWTAGTGRLPELPY